MRLQIRPDYKKFLAQRDRDVEPGRVRVAELPAPTGRARRTEWVDQVAVLLGAKSFAKQIARASNDQYFWDKRLAPYAYVVGRTHEGDPILQVVDGKHAGQILLFDHETYYGVFDDLAKLVDGSRVGADFLKRALPIMTKRGYTSGRPTADQVMAVLLDDELEGAERICASFDELYATVYRYCESRPQPAVANRGRGRAVTFTEIKLGNDPRALWTAMAAGNGVAYVATSEEGLIELRPGRTPVRIADVEDVDRLAIAGTKLYMVSEDKLWRSTGGRSFTSIVIEYVTDVVAAGRGVVMMRNGRLVDHPSGRSRPTKVKHGTCDRIGGTGPAGTFAFTSTELCLVGARPTPIKLPRGVSGIQDVIVTPAGTVLVVTADDGVLRSIDHGTSWSPVPKTAAGWLGAGRLLSTGMIVAAGDKLLISNDDGQTFAVVTARFREPLRCIAELGDELLLATSQYVYGIGLAELRGDGTGRNARGVQPIKKKPYVEPARPLTLFAAATRNYLWQIRPFDQSKAYSVNVTSKAVQVLEQGSRIVYSKPLERERPGRFRVHTDWLVYETYPRQVEAEKRRDAKAAAEWGTGRTLTGVLRR